MNYIKENSVLQPQRLMLLACGSFNPLTPMHLRMFEIAKDHFNTTGNYKVIGGIISPVHDSYGKKGLELAKHRCAMLKLALQSSDWIRLSDWESTQPQWSRTRLILQYHQNYINNFINGANDINEMLPSWLPENVKNSSDNVIVKLLCGADLLESFAVPDLWNEEDIEDIVGQHGIVVVSRNGSNPEQFIFSSDILSRYQRNITTVTNWVPNEVSSTIIRTLLRRGQSVKYLMDDLVIEYIKKHGLYNIKTPAYNTTDSTAAENQNLFNENYLNTLKSSQNIEEMDETDLHCRKDSIHVELIRPKMFCCGSSESTKTILNRPGQAVQIRGTVNTPNDHSKNKTKKLKKSVDNI